VTTTNSIRAVAALALIGALTSACGGGAGQIARVEADVPAATVLSEGDARKFRAENPVPSIEPASVESEQPSAAPLPSRSAGPPGNPTAPSTLANPPTPGVYVADGTVASPQFGNQEFEITIRIQAVETVPGGKRQIHIWETEGSQQEFTYLFADDRIVLERFKGSLDPTSPPQDCTLQPPSIQLLAPLEIGQAWQTSSKCKGEDGPTQKGSSEIVRAEKVAVGGGQVDTYVVESSEPGSEGSAFQWFDPASRLFVKFAIDSPDFLFEYTLRSTSPA